MKTINEEKNRGKKYKNKIRRKKNSWREKSYLEPTCSMWMTIALMTSCMQKVSGPSTHTQKHVGAPICISYYFLCNQFREPFQTNNTEHQHVKSLVLLYLTNSQTNPPQKFHQVIFIFHVFFSKINKEYELKEHSIIYTYPEVFILKFVNS